MVSFGLGTVGLPLDSQLRDCGVTFGLAIAGFPLDSQWDLWFGIYDSGSSIWDLWFGIPVTDSFRYRCLAWGLGFRIFGLRLVWDL